MDLVQGRVFPAGKAAYHRQLPVLEAFGPETLVCGCYFRPALTDAQFSPMPAETVGE